MTTKVEDKRFDNTEAAAKRGDWGEVLRLLDLPRQNAERNDRRHGLLSTNWVIDKAGGSSTELGNLIPDGSLDPLELLLKKEEQATRPNPFEAIQTFNEFEQQILYGRLVEKKSFAKLSRELGRDDKTIKKYFEQEFESLKVLLQ